jgi:sec-independent protein translocase protein TatC
MTAAPELPATIEPVPNSSGGPEMTLMEHLKELRNRVIICAVAIVIATVFCFIFWETIMGWLLAPARAQDPDFRVASFSPTDRIGVLFRIGLYGGLLLSSPVIAYQVLAFIVPGLTPREKKMLLPGVAGCVFFLMGGMAFAYWVILPVSLNFLLNFGSDQFDDVIHAPAYISFVTRIVFWVGLSFELPMVIALAARLGLVTARKLLGFWRYAIIIVFVLAAIVTPTPDPITQTFVAGPLLALYFVGVLLAHLIGKPRQQPELVR